jgi:hypothetical protein
MATNSDSPPHGLTPREVARRYRVSPERVRGWIVRGELGAINLARVRCGMPRYVVLPEHLAAFEQARQVSPLLRNRHSITSRFQLLSGTAV